MTNNNKISNIMDRFQSLLSSYPAVSLRVIHFVENSSRSLSSFFKDLEEMAEEKRRQFSARNTAADSGSLNTATSTNTSRSISSKTASKKAGASSSTPTIDAH